MAASLLDRTAFMVKTLSFKISSMGLFGGVENSDVLNLAVKSNGSYKSFSIGDNTKQANFIVDFCAALILRVRLIGYGPEIKKSIVRSNTIAVVDISRRPFTMHVEPCQPVFFVLFTAYVGGTIAAFCNASCKASSRLVAPFMAARKNAGIWAVVKQFAQALCGKIGISHDAPRKLIGQRPACVDSASRALLF